MAQIKTLTIGDEGTTCNVTLQRDGMTMNLEMTRVFPSNVRDSYVHSQIRCVCGY